MFDTSPEFRYSYNGSTAGQYKRPTSTEFPIHRRRKGPKRQTANNKVCPACGVTRSCANKCECNS